MVSKEKMRIYTLIILLISIVYADLSMSTQIID